MKTAFILVTIDKGSGKKITKDLKEIGGVKEVYTVYGFYDLIVKIQTKTTRELTNIVINNIKVLKNVISTFVLLVDD